MTVPGVARKLATPGYVRSRRYRDSSIMQAILRDSDIESVFVPHDSIIMQVSFSRAGYLRMLPCDQDIDLFMDLDGYGQAWGETNRLKAYDFPL